MTQLLTPDQVAAYLGLSAETLAQWRSQRRGPRYVKVARQVVRYRGEDVDKWVLEQMVETSAN